MKQQRSGLNIGSYKYIRSNSSSLNEFAKTGYELRDSPHLRHSALTNNGPFETRRRGVRGGIAIGTGSVQLNFVDESRDLDRKIKFS